MQIQKLFISYAKHNIDIAERLYQDLKSAGMEPWLDIVNLKPGQQWKSEIRRVIRDCDGVIVLMSEHSVSKRGYVQSEIKQALEILDEIPNDQVFIIPVRIDNCSPSYNKLKDLHWVDLFPSYALGLKKILSVMVGETTEQEKEALLKIYSTEWTGGGAIAETADETFRLASILKNPTPQEISTLNGAACALAFDAEVPKKFSWIVVEQIVVRVKTYHVLPEYKSAYPLPLQLAHVYYVEISAPSSNNSIDFVAKYSFQGSNCQKLAITRLEPEKPERFIVRINACVSGIYVFDLAVVASHKNTKQTISIVEDAVFLFEDC